MIAPPLRPILLLLLIAGLGAGALRAQSYLVVDVNGEGKVVRKISEPFAYVMVDGKLKGVPVVRSGLVPASEFLPAFVTVRGIDARVSGLILGGGNRINNNFSFRATFESPDGLEDVFFVLELKPKRGGKRFYSQGIGRLEPRKPRTISTTVALREELGPGECELHIFSQGLEVLHSDQPEELRAQVLDRMVSKRIAGVKDALPTPLLGPVPVYPKHLVKARAKGEAVVKVHVSATGVMSDPSVESATDPAFGEAAVAAVRQWRFVPRVKEGQPVATTAVVPFAFEPPEAPQKN